MAKRKHGTLVANTVSTVTVSAPSDQTVSHIGPTGSTVSSTIQNVVSSIRVINVSGATAIYVSVDGTTPTVAGDDFYVVPAGVGQYADIGVYGADSVDVKLISTGTPTYAIYAS